MKSCTNCGEVFPESGFYKRTSRGKRYLRSECKECTNRASVVWARNNAESRKRQSQEWAKNNKEKVNAKARRSYQRHKHKAAARSAVSKAVRRGDLPHLSTQTCHCGEAAAHYHHHKGYAEKFWLDVSPICTTCHGLEHRKYA